MSQDMSSKEEENASKYGPGPDPTLTQLSRGKDFL